MRLCAEPGCDKKYLAKGYCQKHYRAHGLSPSHGKPRERDADCIICGQHFSRVTTMQKVKTCSEECRIEAIRKASAERRQSWPQCKVYVRPCKECERLFVGRYSHSCYCSESCSKESHARLAGSRDRSCRDCGTAFPSFYLATYCEPCRAERARISRRDGSKNSKHTRRARIKAGRYEPVKASHVYERDEWTCGICQQPVDRTLTYPDPGSPSLDHVIPLARGGTHTYDNVQIAHLACNHLKSDAMPFQSAPHLTVGA